MRKWKVTVVSTVRDLEVLLNDIEMMQGATVFAVVATAAVGVASYTVVWYVEETRPVTG